MPNQVDDVVAKWFGGDHILAEAISDTPAIAWLAFLKILAHGLDDEQLGLLAAGPLEDFIGIHGTKFIDKIEEEAKRNPKFVKLLSGVWQGGTDDLIWKRIQNCLDCHGQAKLDKSVSLEERVRLLEARTEALYGLTLKALKILTQHDPASAVELIGLLNKKLGKNGDD